MAAIMGNGREYDITFKCDANMKTTTSQYRVVGFVPGTTTSTDRTVQMVLTGTMADFTAAAYYAIGINQSYLSSGSDACTVRLFGVSKAVCAVSVCAGSFVVAYAGASITQRYGCIAELTNGVSCTAYGMTITSQRVVLGRALENGSTGTVISVFVNPQLYDTNLVGTLSA